MILLILIILSVVFRNTEPFPMILKIGWGLYAGMWAIIGILWFLALIGETLA